MRLSWFCAKRANKKPSIHAFLKQPNTASVLFSLFIRLSFVFILWLGFWLKKVIIHIGAKPVTKLQFNFTINIFSNFSFSQKIWKKSWNLSTNGKLWSDSFKNFRNYESTKQICETGLVYLFLCTLNINNKIQFRWCVMSKYSWNHLMMIRS